MNLPDDPFIRELLPEFVDTWLEDIKSYYKVYIDSKDQPELYRLAHTLKGSCYQFGLTDIGDAGIKIMALSKEYKWDEALEYYDFLIDSFEKIKEFLNNDSI